MNTVNNWLKESMSIASVCTTEIACTPGCNSWRSCVLRGCDAPPWADPAHQRQNPARKRKSSTSRQKWLWMAERNTEALDKLIDQRAIFVHMGATMTKSEELGVIESGRIQYKETDIQEISARIIGETAIVLSKIQLFALVGGNEARNPFMVTETT